VYVYVIHARLKLVKLDKHGHTDILVRVVLEHAGSSDICTHAQESSRWKTGGEMDYISVN